MPADLPLKNLLSQAESALQGGVRWLQLRDKKQGFKWGLKRAQRLRTLCDHYQAHLIINDSIPLATESGADGVHLGRDDLPTWGELQTAHNSGQIVGVTCRADASLAQAALDGGADYLSFGAVFPTRSKSEVPTIGLPRLVKAKQMFPDANIVAIGGITKDNIIQVKTAGADAAAIISGLFATNDITDRAKMLTALWQ